MKEGKLITGKCGSPFALDGAVRLYTENSNENLKREKMLTLRKGNKEFVLEVRDIFSKSDRKYISFVGITTPEDARLVLSGAEILVSRENAAMLSDDEVYCADLVGLDVYFEGVKVAVVRSWSEGPQSIFLHIETSDGREHIVPYMKVFVSEPDMEKNRIDILNKELLV